MDRAITGSGKKYIEIEIDNKECIAYYKKQAENDQDAALKTKKQIQDKIVLQKQQYAQELRNRKAWKMVLRSDLFKGALMLLPSIFTRRIGLFGFGKMFKGVLDLPGISMVALANHRTRQQALRKIEGDPSLPSVESVFLNNLETQMKTPADLDGQDLNDLFAGLEEPPITIQFPNIHIDFDIETNLKARNIFTSLSVKFNWIRVNNYLQEFSLDTRFSEHIEDIKEFLIKIKDKDIVLIL